MSYIEFPMGGLDYDAMVAEAFDALQAAYPDWIPHEANLDVQLIEVITRLMLETATVASLVPPGIFRWYGRNVVNIPPIDAVAATVPSTWDLSDTAGHTIKRGTVLSLQKTGDENAFFLVKADVVVAPGESSTSSGEVILVAANAGIDPNGIPAGSATLAESLAWVDQVTTTATTAGGIAPETDDAYVSRLSREMQLLSPAPILPDDFAVLAVNVAGVARAHAVDTYNPADSTYDNERMVAVALVDAAGVPVSTDIKNAVKGYLEALREVNFVVNVMDPTYQTVNITVTVHMLTGADSDVVETACVDALTSYLDPTNWNWSGVVRVNEIISLLDRVTGVDWVETPTTPSADVTLSGAAPLPTIGTLTVIAVT